MIFFFESGIETAYAEKHHTSVNACRFTSPFKFTSHSLNVFCTELVQFAMLPSTLARGPPVTVRFDYSSNIIHEIRTQVTMCSGLYEKGN